VSGVKGRSCCRFQLLVVRCGEKVLQLAQEAGLTEVKPGYSLGARRVE
jgi:hypothetical protein